MKQPNFDHIARPYRWLEYLSLGRALERCRFHFLLQLLDRRRALIMGDGDGRFTAKLLAENPSIEVDAIDISQTMLALLRQRAESTSDRLRTHHADARTFPYDGPKNRYDLVVTHFFLDCFSQPDLDQLIERIEPALAPEALWIISDFRIPAGPMRFLARAYVRGLYLAFRVLTGLKTTQLPDYATPLAKQGFTCEARHHSLAGLLTTELWRRDDKDENPPEQPRIR